MTLPPEVEAACLRLAARPSRAVRLPRPEPVSEEAFQADVIRLAKSLGYLVYHTRNSKRCEPGYPDLCLCGHGRLIFAELKTRTGTVSPEQAAWLEAIRAAGVPAFVWRPESWDELSRVLTEGSR